MSYSACVTKSVNCRHGPKILNRLSLEIVSSERIRLPTFSNNYYYTTKVKIYVKIN